MRKVSHFICLCIVITASLMTILLAGMFMGSTAHAATGGANFSLLPVKIDPANPITRAYFVFNVHASANLRNSVRIINVGAARGAVDLYPVDTTTSQYSGVAYQSRNMPRVDVAAWIHLAFNHVVLAPGESYDVPFYLALPRFVRSGQHVGGIVAENVTLQHVSTNKDKGILFLKKDTVIPVVVNIPGRRIETLLTNGVRFDSSKSFQRLLIGLANTGNLLLQPSGSLEVRDMQGRLVQTNTLNLDALLPRTVIQYPINIRNKALPIGRYRATLQLTYGKYTRKSINNVSFFTIVRSGSPLMDVAAVVGVPKQSFRNMFSQLSPWHYIIGGSVLILIGSALFFWIQKVCTLIVGLQQKRKGSGSQEY